MRTRPKNTGKSRRRIEKASRRSFRDDMADFRKRMDTPPPYMTHEELATLKARVHATLSSNRSRQ
jgi:hypothetical protein